MEQEAALSLIQLNIPDSKLETALHIIQQQLKREHPNFNEILLHEWVHKLMKHKDQIRDLSSQLYAKLPPPPLPVQNIFQQPFKLCFQYPNRAKEIYYHLDRFILVQESFITIANSDMKTAFVVFTPFVNTECLFSLKGQILYVFKKPYCYKFALTQSVVTDFSMKSVLSRKLEGSKWREVASDVVKMDQMQGMCITLSNLEVQLNSTIVARLVHKDTIITDFCYHQNYIFVYVTVQNRPFVIVADINQQQQSEIAIESKITIVSEYKILFLHDIYKFEQSTLRSDEAHPLISALCKIDDQLLFLTFKNCSGVIRIKIDFQSLQQKFAEPISQNSFITHTISQTDISEFSLLDLKLPSGFSGMFPEQQATYLAVNKEILVIGVKLLRNNEAIQRQIVCIFDQFNKQLMKVLYLEKQDSLIEIQLNELNQFEIMVRLTTKTIIFNYFDGSFLQIESNQAAFNNKLAVGLSTNFNLLIYSRDGNAMQISESPFQQLQYLTKQTNDNQRFKVDPLYQMYITRFNQQYNEQKIKIILTNQQHTLFQCDGNTAITFLFYIHNCNLTAKLDLQTNVQLSEQLFTELLENTPVIRQSIPYSNEIPNVNINLQQRSQFYINFESDQEYAKRMMFLTEEQDEQIVKSVIEVLSYLDFNNRNIIQGHMDYKVLPKDSRKVVVFQDKIIDYDEPFDFIEDYSEDEVFVQPEEVPLITPIQDSEEQQRIYQQVKKLNIEYYETSLLNTPQQVKIHSVSSQILKPGYCVYLCVPLLRVHTHYLSSYIANDENIPETSGYYQLISCVFKSEPINALRILEVGLLRSDNTSFTIEIVPMSYSYACNELIHATGGIISADALASTFLDIKNQKAVENIQVIKKKFKMQLFNELNSQETDFLFTEARKLLDIYHDTQICNNWRGRQAEFELNNVNSAQKKKEEKESKSSDTYEVPEESVSVYEEGYDSYSKSTPSFITSSSYYGSESKSPVKGNQRQVKHIESVDKKKHWFNKNYEKIANGLVSQKLEKQFQFVQCTDQQQAPLISSRSVFNIMDEIVSITKGQNHFKPIVDEIYTLQTAKQPTLNNPDYVNLTAAFHRLLTDQYSILASQISRDYKQPRQQPSVQTITLSLPEQFTTFKNSIEQFTEVSQLTVEQTDELCSLRTSTTSSDPYLVTELVFKQPIDKWLSFANYKQVSKGKYTFVYEIQHVVCALLILEQAQSAVKRFRVTGEEILFGSRIRSIYLLVIQLLSGQIRLSSEIINYLEQLSRDHEDQMQKAILFIQRQFCTEYNKTFDDRIDLRGFKNSCVREGEGEYTYIYESVYEEEEAYENEVIASTTSSDSASSDGSYSIASDYSSD
ncbi:Hypothetical_protein [Hexamita inflata]|uniref:Hypothetical_protein n=1 Tax=Hexamita inflata TaxID=28002 RepID=A0AA86N7P9_9EUKA|nr:Hypothetical protein HINF_LOCUS1896 [Hexamita inflata]